MLNKNIKHDKFLIDFLKLLRSLEKPAYMYAINSTVNKKSNTTLKFKFITFQKSIKLLKIQNKNTEILHRMLDFF